MQQSNALGTKQTEFGLAMPVAGSKAADPLPGRASKEIDHES